MHSILGRTLAVITILVVVSTVLRAQQDPVKELVLSEGTAIEVVTDQAISSKDAKPNDPVKFSVNQDVAVDGNVIVRKGTAAVGSVVNAEKRGYLGKSGKLAIQVESTQTVDSKPLKLRAAKGREGDDKTNSTAALSMLISPLFLFKKGGEATIAAGTTVTVYVAEEKRFRLEDAAIVTIESDKAAVSDAAEATVFIYRPSKMMGKALEPSVFVDDTELARMDNGRYFALKLKPGKHIVRMTDDKKGYAIDMGPGQTYFFRIGIEMGMWKGHGKITLDDRDRAIKEIQKLKFIGQDKIKATTMIVELAPQ